MTSKSAGMSQKRVHPDSEGAETPNKRYRSSPVAPGASPSSESSSESAADSDSDSDSDASASSSSDESDDSDSSSSDESSSSTSSSDASDSSDAESSTEEVATLPPGVTLYTKETPPTKQVLGSYFAQRHRLFSLYDSGIWMTDNSWFEVTPEAIGAEIAARFSETFEAGFTVVDAFCGVGGNSIQFALRDNCAKVYAIDTDPAAIACAKHNAALYGVAEKIEFIVGDFFELRKTRLRGVGVTAVFLSPPWGGPEYRGDVVFGLDTMQPYNASTIVEASRELTRNLALYIPRTSDLNQLAKLLPDGEMVEAVHYCVSRKSKALTAYFGELSWQE